jgi:hypothetical protein
LAFDFAVAPWDVRPVLPNPDWGALKALIEGNLSILLGTFNHGRVYPVPPNSMPAQEMIPVRGVPRWKTGAGCPGVGDQIVPR